jgi:hypothetical protein
MNRITSLLALGFFSLGLATSASAQTKVTQLVIQNATGTTKLSQTSGGLDVDNKIVIHNPSVLTNTVTLLVPSDAGMGNANFTFPTSGGTLLTNATNTFTNTQTFPTDGPQGNALIASINAGTTTINAARLNLSSLNLGGVTSVAAGNTTLDISTNNLTNAVTASLNLANANTWTAVQTFPSANDATGIAQGNALINSINRGTTALTGYATTNFLTSNYTNTADMTTLINNTVNNPANLPSTVLLESEVVGTAGQINHNVAGGTVTLSLPSVAANTGTFTNATVTIDAQGRVIAASNGTGNAIEDAVVLANDFNSSNASLADVTGMSFAVSANSVYMVEMTLRIGNSSADGTKLGITGPSASTLTAEVIGTTTSTGTLTERLTSLGTETSYFNTVADQNGLVKIWGFMKTGATAGNLQLQSRAKTGAVTASVLGGSIIKYRKVK